MASKVGDQGAFRETPYPDMTVIAPGGKLFAAAIEYEAGNERGAVREHVNWFKPRRFEDMNFGSRRAARQVPRIRAKGEAGYVVAQVKAWTDLVASLYVED